MTEDEAKSNTVEELKTEEMSSLLDALEDESAEVVDTSQEDSEVNAISETDSTIVRLVNKVLTDAYDQGVSDIHLEPGTGKKPVKVRFRKDGACRVYQEIPYLYKQAIISRIKIMSKLDIAERRMPQDGKIKMKYGRKDIEYRVATCPTVGGNEDAVLRILAASKPIPLEKMNFSDRNLDLIQEKSTKPYGLILVVGPTGSGKTTTLHSCLGYINKPETKIWTAEDPVEITQDGLRQVQMLNKIGLDFARAMKSFLRGDPDVIMVGEMRDAETCSIGLEASLTGHLVFSTLHTNSAPETITRLIDMGMNPLNFADALLLIVAQRLVRTLCKQCKEDYHPDQEEFDELVKQYGPNDFKNLNIDYTDDLLLKKPVGCASCNETGYAGRTGIHELLDGTDDMKRLIMKNEMVENLRAQAISDGMTTLKQDGIYKIFKGDCDLKQVLAVCIV
jgi:type II secretory ATPase GspE/PulE/Tfp pilus assembly ATPase PilB-like protein